MYQRAALSAVSGNAKLKRGGKHYPVPAGLLSSRVSLVPVWGRRVSLELLPDKAYENFSIFKKICPSFLIIYLLLDCFFLIISSHGKHAVIRNTARQPLFKSCPGKQFFSPIP
jgi:hypothetical protein